MGDLPHDWAMSIVGQIYRLREAGIEPTHVLLPLHGTHTLPATIMGIPVMWSEELAYPHVSIECS